MKKTLRPLLAAFALAALAQGAAAQNQMLDALKDRLGSQGSQGSGAGGTGATGAAGAAGALSGLQMPAIGQGTLGNAAGVLQYCIKNNYLSAGAAGGIKDKLMGMVRGDNSQQSGYDTGAKGLLQGSGGQSFDLKSVGAKLKTRACDYVLKNSRSLI